MLGNGVIEILRGFVRRDIKTAATYEAEHFSHIDDSHLRRALAETMYGARWLYALGIVTLVKGMERNAHVRVQVIDYSAICEALLGAMTKHALAKGHMGGSAYLFMDPPRNTRALRTPLTAANADRELRRRSFYWLIEVAKDEGIIEGAAAKMLHRLRRDRNSVHLLEHAAHGQRYYLDKGRAVKQTLNQTIEDTKAWRATHP